MIKDYIENNTLKIIVKPNSPKTKVIDYDENRKALKIAIKGQPEKGKANETLLKFLKKETKLNPIIISGKTSQLKIIKFSTITKFK